MPLWVNGLRYPVLLISEPATELPGIGHEQHQESSRKEAQGCANNLGGGLFI